MELITKQIGSGAVEITVPDELNPENLKKTISRVQEQCGQIKAIHPGGTFPCGFVSLHVSGRSKLIGLIKKYGEERMSDSYEFAGLRAGKNNYKGGYSISLKYPKDGPYMAQSLNFKRPLYSLLQDALGVLGVETELNARVD